MLMSRSKGKTAVHDCLCLRDMAVRMREVLARPWVGVCVPLALSLNYFQGNFRLCNRIKFNLFFLLYFMTFLKKIQQSARIGKIFPRWHLAIAITSYYSFVSFEFCCKDTGNYFMS